MVNPNSYNYGEEIVEPDSDTGVDWSILAEGDSDDLSKLGEGDSADLSKPGEETKNDPIITEQVELPLDEEKRKGAFFEALDGVFTKLKENPDDITEEEIDKVDALLQNIDTDFWDDRDFVDTLIEKTSLASEDTKAYNFLEYGMPIKTILDNPDYYDEMVSDEQFCSSFKDGTLSMFYDAMSSTEEGKARFQRDFIESGATASKIDCDLYDLSIGRGPYDDTIADLKVAKKCGLTLFGGGDIVFDSHLIPRQREEILHDRERGQRLMERMHENGLFDGKELAKVFEYIITDASGSDSAVGEGIIDKALEYGIKPESDNIDVNYWYELSQEKGENELAVFLDTNYGRSRNHFGIAGTQESDEHELAELRQRDFDFSNESVMRLFIKDEKRKVGIDEAKLYQGKRFLNALRQPNIQSIVLSNIEKTENGIPSLFFMMAQDQENIRVFQGQNAFDDCQLYKTNEKIPDFVGKITNGTLVARDVIELCGLMNHNGFYRKNGPTFRESEFDADGRLTESGLDHWASLSLPLGFIEVPPGFWNQKLEEGKYELLSKQSSEVLEENGFNPMMIDCINGIAGRVFQSNNKEINEQNVISALARFIRMDAQDWEEETPNDIIIKEAFGDTKVKDLALGQLKRVYSGYLQGEKDAQFPVGLKTLADYMHTKDGAGPLTQIEAFLDFAGVLGNTGEHGRELTALIENKMQENRWDNQEKTNFYAISAEVIEASPEIYEEFAELFVNIPNKDDFKTFTTEIYPLFRAKLALIKHYEDHSNGVGTGYATASYNYSEVYQMQKQLHNALLPFNLQELSAEKRKEGIDRVRETIFGEITELFQSKFGILPKAIPETLDKSNAKAIEDLTLYLSNMAEPDAQKKAILGYFLALQFDKNGAWDKMRSGEDIAPSQSLNVVSAFNVSQALETSKANNPINAENTRLDNPEKLVAFRRALQGEVTSMRLGNVQTVDLKIQNLMGNIAELTDPDLYAEPIDRQRVELLGHHSVKTVGKIAANMYQRMNGKDIPLTEEEQRIAVEMESILRNNNLDFTSDNIKEYFQDGLKGLKEPFSMMETMKTSGAVESIKELQEMLMPPTEIIQIFEKLGESFKTQSGVVALSADLNSLDNLVTKRENELSEDEMKLVREYINAVRNKLAELDNIYKRTVQNYEKMKKSIHANPPEGVKQKIKEIDSIVGAKDPKSIITTTCTNELTTIIENMRACLSCKTKGVNNDTNLTFGEGYKFYLYSSNNTSHSGSIADEIVYFVPMGEGENQRMGFVMDQIYGAKNSDILISHLENMLKKASRLKETFPDVPISIVLPRASMLSCGVSLDAESLRQRIELPTDVAIQDLANETVVVPESGFGEHYIEFGDNKNGREAGPRKVSGVEIRL